MSKESKQGFNVKSLKYDWSALYEILCIQRGAGSMGEVQAIADFIEPVCGEPDGFGNYIHIVGNSPIMWACHTDTVHGRKRVWKAKSGEPEPAPEPLEVERQTVLLNDKGKLFTPDGDCLGADCGTGMAIMLNMIAHNVPGVYVFHREEEIGGNGSQYIADKKPDWLADIKACVSFDRYGYGEIITHQGARCCSDAFAHSLANQLNKLNPKFNYYPSPDGVFTDSANYMYQVSECTNISVGYFGHHTAGETQCMVHLDRLLDAIIKLDQSALVFKRDPAEWDYDYSRWDSGYHGMGFDSPMESMIEENPDCVAKILHDLGYDESSLADEIYTYGGVVRPSLINL